MALRLVWPDDRHHRHVVQLGVVQPVEQVDRPRARGGHADADPASELGVPDRLEGGHLLVPGLDELRLVVGSAPGGQDPVDPVAGVGEHVLARPRRAAARAGSRQLSVPCLSFRGRYGPSMVRSCRRTPGGQVVGRPGGEGHDGQGGVGAALGGEHAAVGDVEVGDGEAAAEPVDDAVPLVCGHPGAADQVRVALDGDDLVRARGVQDVLHDRLRGAGQRPVVVALGVGEAGPPAGRRSPSPRPASPGSRAGAGIRTAPRGRTSARSRSCTRAGPGPSAPGRRCARPR